MLLLMTLLAGCPGPDDSSLVFTGELDPCGFAEAPAGLIDVSNRRDSWHEGAFTRVEALLQQGPSPEFYRTAQEQGACRLLEAAYTNCAEICDHDELCTASGECLPWPEGASGGTLTITGLGSPLVLESEGWSPGTYYGLGDLDPFDADMVIGAELEGEVFPALSLQALGVQDVGAELVEGGLLLLDGQDNALSWTAGPDPTACLRLVLYGYNAVHGAPLNHILHCETTDSGSLALPQALVEALPHGETPEITAGHDWPHSELTRYTRASVDTELGPARLLVRSSSAFRFNHPE